MNTTLTIKAGTAASQRSAIIEAPWVRRALVALALAFLAAFLLLPLACVYYPVAVLPVAAALVVAGVAVIVTAPPAGTGPLKISSSGSGPGSVPDGPRSASPAP